MNRKSQIKLFESIAVLVIFVFLLAIGMKFYTNVQLGSLEEAERKFKRLDSLKSSVVLSNLPEISCSKEGITDSNCFNLYKIKSWSDLIKEDAKFTDYYVTVLGNSMIEIQSIYPKEKTWTIYNSSVGGSYDYTVIPITIYDSIEDQNNFGILKIKTFYGKR
ncbi:MAG: hypothetical protein ACQER9_01835 [Nanobdellota archaeon]